MPIQLRERRTQHSHKDIPQSENNDVDFSGEGASEESAFDPPAQEQNDSAAGWVAVDDYTSNKTGPVDTKKQKKKKVKPASAHPTKGSTSIHLAPGLSRPMMRQQYILPAPSVNHRHRGIPLYFPTQRTIRLVEKPRPFFHASTVWTRSIGDSVVRRRVTRAFGYNIGRGPIWELLEDRSWYKEIISEDRSRPLVYQNIGPGAFHVLSDVQAALYLPGGSETDTTIACYLGPRDEQSKVNLKRFDSQAMRTFFPESSAHVFYAGAPVWSLDWCPVSVEDLHDRNYKQYIALGPLPSHSYHPEIGRRVTRPTPACIQIWSLSPTSQAGNNIIDEPGKMDCEMTLCVDGGPAHDLKWCPLPAHDKVITTPKGQPKKLGILGGTFEDGSLSFYVVPDPTTLSDSNSCGPAFVKVFPKLRIELDDTACWCLDWGNSDIVAVGCTNGYIAVFRIQEALENPPKKPLRPSNYIAVHQSAIRSLCWAKAPPVSSSGIPRAHADPTVILSVGYDGAHMVTDIRDGRGNIMSRARDIINDVAFSHHIGASLASDNDNMVKNFSLIPSMLGRGHAILEPSGPVWSVATSDFHPHIAVGSADGTCQTTNILKSTRRGGLAPFLVHKIFQLDYNRILGEFRILENLMPSEHQDSQNTSANQPDSRDTAEETSHPGNTGAWSPEISVTRVTWNSGSDIARAPLLASATASGLCRIDWLLGRFVQDRFPYQSIQLLRGEIEGDIDPEDEDN